ncbi:MAG: helix-turn-helix domain-containing protein [Candidatus Dojkabacteria bacterium]
MINQEYLKLGQKIRNFRIRTGRSQLELEIEMESSSGSLSRIENGEVNPTKETLMKLITILNLSSFEAATLFGFEMTDIPNLLKTSVNIANAKDLEEVLQRSVNDIVFELNLLGSFITLVEGDRLFAKTTTQTWYTELSMKVIGKQFNSLSVSLIEDTSNLMVRTFLDRKVYYSEDVNDFIIPAVNKTIANILKSISGAKSGVSFPIISKSKVLGTIYFGKNYMDDLKNEQPILQAFTDYIAMALEKFDNK